jgi:hypothetical protein
MAETIQASVAEQNQATSFCRRDALEVMESCGCSCASSRLLVGIRRGADLALAGVEVDGRLLGSGRLGGSACFGVFQAEAFAVQFEDMNVVGESIEQRASEPLGAGDVMMPPFSIG